MVASVGRSTRNRSDDAIPVAAPSPMNHHAAIPAYAWVVVSKPPFA